MTCTACDQPVRCRGLCARHYDRLRKTGTIELRRVVNPHCTEPECTRPVVGHGLCEPHYRAVKRRKGAPCTIDGCTSPQRARGWCELHYARWKYHGSPDWQRDYTYTGWHSHLALVLGPAAARLCIDCAQPADEWSYDHADPNEVVEQSDKGSRPFSLDPTHYAARCRPCHRSFDRSADRDLAGCDTRRHAES